MSGVSAYDDDFERARSEREKADAAARKAIESMKPPTGAASVRFWTEVRRMAGDRVWPAVEELRESDQPPTWRELGWIMETTEATLRNAFSRWNSRSS